VSGDARSVDERSGHESADATRTVRWGVLSTANIGRAAVNPAIRASSNGELVAVASRDEARARAFAETHDIPHAFGSYEALLERDDIDAVYIPLPNSLHRDWAIRAAEAGRPSKVISPQIPHMGERTLLVQFVRALLIRYRNIRFQMVCCTIISGMEPRDARKP